MALIHCPECGKEISDKSTVCIHCGYPISELDNNINVVSEEGKQERQQKDVSAEDTSFDEEVKKPPYSEHDTQTIIGSNTGEVNNDEPITKKKKNKMIIPIIICVLVAIAIIIIVKFAVPSEFERVKNEAISIAGQISYGKNYFTIDTYPYEDTNMDEMLIAVLAPDTQEQALNGIKHVNEALGFNGSLYSDMLKTTALMGRQTEENNKYKVSWSYHPDEGLEVTYEKK